MNNLEIKYSQFALCREMLETVEVIQKFNQDFVQKFLPVLHKSKKLLITGEGSSRIFPAKHLLYQINSLGIDLFAFTEGCLQAGEYDLKDTAVFGVSNSGKTKELVHLLNKLKTNHHNAFYGITATTESPLEKLALDTHILQCGKENAVAATKSVIEQALVLEALLYAYLGQSLSDLNLLSNYLHQVLTQPVDNKIIEAFAKAPFIYYAGRNDGVAEELTLKTNEITRKKSAFLEGTYALHGIEEIMRENELLVIINPFESEEEKFEQVILKGVGMNVVAISSRPTRFPTIRIPDNRKFSNYLELELDGI